MEILVHMRRRSLIFALILCAFIVASGCAEDNTYQEEADRLAVLLNWQQGSVVADIGAGRGELTLIAAKSVGPDRARLRDGTRHQKARRPGRVCGEGEKHHGTPSRGGSDKSTTRVL